LPACALLTEPTLWKLLTFMPGAKLDVMPKHKGF
jgi:hypothetical protein